MIIFDLDDTLIDTSGAITPFKMKECLKGFVEDGLFVPDFEQAYQRLLQINAKAYKSKDALVQFLTEFEGDPSLVQRALREMVQPLPSDFHVPTTPHAKEILAFLAASHRLAIVTGGYPPFQMQKLEKAGIDRSIFSKIAIPEDSIKKPFYEGLIQEFSLSPQEVIVCGDRIAMDLAPAHELGLTTVHMRWGRGQAFQTEGWVHHAIFELSELKRIVKI